MPGLLAAEAVTPAFVGNGWENPVDELRQTNAAQAIEKRRMRRRVQAPRLSTRAASSAK